MPEGMNGDDADTLAAEYVLGTLDAAEREQARSLLSFDDAFAARVKFWERRFGELHLMVEPVEPEADIWLRIKAKLPVVEPATPIASIKSEVAPEPDVAPAPELVPEPVTDATAELAPIPELEVKPEAEGEPQTPEVEDGTRTQTESPPPEQPPMPVTPSSLQTGSPSGRDIALALSKALFGDEVPYPAPAASAPPVAPSAPPPAPTPEETVAVQKAAIADDHKEVGKVRRRLLRWRVFATLLMLMLLSLAALFGTWRFAPQWLPPQLQPVALMRLAGITLPTAPPRTPAPPESQYDE
jgi:hypothetical protein